MEYYSAFKMEETVTHSTTWMNFKDILPTTKPQMLCDSTQMWSLAVELDTRMKGPEGHVIDCSVATGSHIRVLGRVLGVGVGAGGDGLASV